MAFRCIIELLILNYFNKNNCWTLKFKSSIHYSCSIRYIVTYRKFEVMALMWKNLLEVIYHRLLQIVGLCNYNSDLKHNKWWRVYSMVLCLILIIGLIDATVNDSVPLTFRFASLNSLVSQLQGVGIKLCHIIILIEQVICSKKYGKIIQNLIELIKNVENLSSKRVNEFDWLQIHMKVLLIGFVYIAATIASVCSFYTPGFVVLFKLWTLFIAAFITNSLRCLQLYRLIHAIEKILLSMRLLVKEFNFKGYRYQSTFACFLDLDNFNNDKIKIWNGRDDLESNYAKLQKMKSYYHKLWILSNDISYNFGVSMLMNFGYTFLAITGTSYFFFVAMCKDSMDAQSKIFFTVIIFSYLTPFIISIYSICNICGKVEDQVNVSEFLQQNSSFSFYLLFYRLNNLGAQ